MDLNTDKEGGWHQWRWLQTTFLMP